MDLRFSPMALGTHRFGARVARHFPPSVHPLRTPQPPRNSPNLRHVRRGSMIKTGGIGIIVPKSNLHQATFSMHLSHFPALPTILLGLGSSPSMIGTIGQVETNKTGKRLSQVNRSRIPGSPRFHPRGIIHSTSDSRANDPRHCGADLITSRKVPGT